MCEFELEFFNDRLLKLSTGAVFVREEVCSFWSFTLIHIKHNHKILHFLLVIIFNLIQESI